MPLSEAQQDMKFQAEQDLRTLLEVKAIKKDKTRLKRALQMAKQQLAALKSVS